MRFCELDERQCDSVLCTDGGAGCAKRTMKNRCDIRACCAEAAYQPRLLYYPDNGEGHRARPAPLTLSAKVCAACRVSLDAYGKGVKAFATQGMDNLATNLLVADGRQAPNLNLTRLVWVPLGTVRMEGEGILEEAREKTAILRL